MNEELKQFDIDLNKIKGEDSLFKNIEKAIDEMRLNTFMDRFELVLNKNLIKCKDMMTNQQVILGCRVSYAELDEAISFIVREDFKPSYEALEERIDKAIDYIENNLSHFTSNGIATRKYLIEILKGEE